MSIEKKPAERFPRRMLIVRPTCPVRVPIPQNSVNPLEARGRLRPPVLRGTRDSAIEDRSARSSATCLEIKLHAAAHARPLENSELQAQQRSQA
jgi:hypothetical protein